MVSSNDVLVIGPRREAVLTGARKVGLVRAAAVAPRPRSASSPRSGRGRDSSPSSSPSRPAGSAHCILRRPGAVGCRCPRRGQRDHVLGPARPAGTAWVHDQTWNGASTSPRHGPRGTRLPPDCPNPGRNRYLIWVARHYGAEVSDPLEGTVAAALRIVSRRVLAAFTRRWPRPASSGAAVRDALLDLVARDHVIDSTDLAALEAGNDLLQTLPSPVHVQRGLSLVEDSVVFESSDLEEIMDFGEAIRLRRTERCCVGIAFPLRLSWKRVLASDVTAPWRGSCPP